MIRILVFFSVVIIACSTNSKEGAVKADMRLQPEIPIYSSFDDIQYIFDVGYDMQILRTQLNKNRAAIKYKL